MLNNYLEISVLESAVLRKIYSEDRPMYFKNLPEIVSNIVPQVKVQQRLKLALKKPLKGTSDVSGIPLHQEDKIIGIIIVFGPLTEMQKKIFKDIINDFESKLLN